MMARIKSVGEDVEKLELSYLAGGNVNWCSHLEKLVVSQKVKHRVIIVTQQFHFQVYIQEK